MATPKVLALVMIVTAMFSAGLQVEREHLGRVIRKYGLIGKALLANLVLLPAFAYLLVQMFHVNSEVATGILLMAMAPGVPFLVRSAGLKVGGNLEFAAGIAVFFSALSVVTIPITARLVLPPDAELRVPVQNFLVTLVAFQLVPLILGVLAAPHVADALRQRYVKVFNLIFLVAVAGLLVVLGPKLVSSVGAVYGGGQLAIIAAIGIFALAIGWLLGGPDTEFRRTLSVATDLRNIGLCALIATEDFSDTLVFPTIVAYFVVTFVLSLPVRFYLHRTTEAPAAG